MYKSPKYQDLWLRIIFPGHLCVKPSYGMAEVNALPPYYQMYCTYELTSKSCFSPSSAFSEEVTKQSVA